MSISSHNPFIVQNNSNQSSLGRGLSSLIPKKNNPLNTPERRAPINPASYFPKANSGVSNQILQVPPALIQINPYQPRQEFGPGALESLKNSIQEHGILQPLVVTQTLGGKYELVAGERRLRAARELNLKTVPVIVRTAKDLEKLELSLIENIQREDLNPIEKAVAYKQLIDNFNLTQEEAAKRLGIARSSLNNNLRLLNLPEDIQLALASGKISESQAKLILGVSEADQQKIFHRAKEGNLTVKEVEHEVKKVKVKSYLRTQKKDPTITGWESRLSSELGTKVSIRRRGHSGGVVEIEFYSDEELENIISNLI
ncbi:ParB/RepB/Spo0J family partition protein [Candidatus Kuenenbacteria bacterium]|nr:ParB/RepB/Spo0J family partition protein [Candidatus Kuenenbacteria bacterium]